MQTISMVPPSVGEISPTTVMADVMAGYPNGIEELKRMINYNQQLFFPEEPLVGNNLIKVWNIEDELEAEHKNRLGLSNHSINNHSSSSNIPHHFWNSAKTFSFDPEDEIDEVEEEHHHLPLAEISFPIHRDEEDDEDNDDEDNEDDDDEDNDDENNVDVDEDENEDEDELFAHYDFRFRPRPSSDPLPESISVPCPPPPMSPLVSDRGSSHTVIIDDLDLGLGLNWGDDNDNDNHDDEETETRPKGTRRRSRGHRKSHRRNHSHFDFRFE